MLNTALFFFQLSACLVGSLPLPFNVREVLGHPPSLSLVKIEYYESILKKVAHYTAGETRHTLDHPAQGYIFSGMAGMGLPRSNARLTAGVSPHQQRGWQLTSHRRTPGKTLQQLIGPSLLPTLPDSNNRLRQYSTELASLASEAISWTTEDKWVVELPRPLRHLPRTMTPEEKAFWLTNSWAENPWVVDMHRESAHIRVPVERAEHYRKQARPISPQETTVPAVQRFGRCAVSNCRDALEFSERYCMANSSSTADANSSLGS